MFYFICTVIQLILWWVTFFKTKKMIREKVGSGWNSSWGEFRLTSERFKFPLGAVLLGFLLCFIPIIGLIVYVLASISISNMPDGDFEEERPSFAIIELFKKKI